MTKPKSFFAATRRSMAVAALFAATTLASSVATSASAHGTGAVGDLERASSGLGTAARLAPSKGYPEFSNLAVRSEDVLVSAGLADQAIGGWCANYLCWYDAECGQNCVCLSFDGWWGFCWRHGP
ncbi:MAG: hypothetical protein OXG82_15095 [Gammaproteobacteria bacterium]|nr:hypothetical protein [Gammaproteobacteria bacterium]